jgi:hypothetical protein
MPSADAARSLVRTAISRRPELPRRTFAIASAQTTNRAKMSSAHRLGYRTESRSMPKRLCAPTGVPSRPPVRSALANTVAETATPRLSVTTARLMPRARRAGRAKTTPTSIVTATPAMSASRNGTCASTTSRPATSVAIPPSANCASESCPAYPSSTTMDNRMMPQLSVTPSAITSSSGRTQPASAAKMTSAGTRMRQSTRPEPSVGRFSAAAVRDGNPFPRSTSRATMTTNGTVC